MADIPVLSAPAISEEEIHRRLAACYRLLLSLGRQQPSDLQADEPSADGSSPAEDIITSF
jgi:hypothetical protein